MQYNVHPKLGALRKMSWEYGRLYYMESEVICGLRHLQEWKGEE